MVIKKATYESLTMMRKKTHPGITPVNLVITLINSVNTEKDMDFQSSDWVHAIEVMHRGGMDMVILEKDADFVNLAENTKDLELKSLLNTFVLLLPFVLVLYFSMAGT